MPCARWWPKTCGSSSDSCRREIRKAQEAGESLDPRVDPAQLAFELDALGSAANQHFQILRDRSVFERAATAIRARLDLVDAK